jgi:hypothetical protein
VAVVLRDADQARAQPLTGIVTIAEIVRLFATIRIFLRVDIEGTRSYDSRVFLTWQSSSDACADAAARDGNGSSQAIPEPGTFPDQNRFCGV